MSDIVRERVVQWHDPAELAAATARMSGLELLRAIRDGDVPAPAAVAVLGVGFDDVAEGVMRLHMDPQEFHYNAIGSVHGGVLATLLDTVLGCAVHSTLPQGQGYTTLDIAVRFIKPVRLGTGRVFAEATLVHRGRTTAVSRASLRDQNGVLHATAESTCLIFAPATSMG